MLTLTLILCCLTVLNCLVVVLLCIAMRKQQSTFQRIKERQDKEEAAVQIIPLDTTPVDHYLEHVTMRSQLKRTDKSIILESKHGQETIANVISSNMPQLARKLN